MSDGLCNIASGDYVELRAWRGRDWILSAKTLRQFAEIERFILNRRGDPLTVVLNWAAGLSRELSDAKAAEVVARQVDQALKIHLRSRFAVKDEIHDYNHTPAGMGHRLWMAAREHQRDMSIEECTEHVLRATDEEIARLSDALDGTEQEAQIKNSAGPAQNGAA